MKKTRFLLLGLAAIVAFTFGSAPAFAAYPTKAVEFIIPFGAGGGADIEGRILAKEMSKILGVPFVPINKVGAGGAVTYTYVKNAKPDGYTIAWNSTSVLTSTNIGNVPFAYTALDHIGRVEVQPLPFAVKSTSPWKTFKEFVADCKKKPGTLKVANASIGSSTHLGAVAMMTAAGCKVIHLPVGIKRRNASVLSGEAHAMVAPLTGAIRLAKANKIRLLAIPTAKRNRVIPNVPTMNELGYNTTIEFFRGLSVPKGTPSLVKAKLADAMMRAARSKAFTDFAKKKGFTVAPLDSSGFGAYLAAQNKIVKGIMQNAGIYQSKRKKK
ncbi:MAG: tripartite tricarboxylate transporter substrate binding protein [bacterium]